MKNFAEKVYDIVRKIPKGYVITYGQIAELIDNPKASRAVGNALHSNPDPIKVPCYKVVNSKGQLANKYRYGGIKKQKEFLEKDEIEVVNYCVDLNKYQWKKKKP